MSIVYHKKSASHITGPIKPVFLTYEGKEHWFRSTADACRWAREKLGLPNKTINGREVLESLLRRMDVSNVRYPKQ